MLPVRSFGRLCTGSCTVDTQPPSVPFSRLVFLLDHLNRESEPFPAACGGVSERTENRFFILTGGILSRGLPRGGFNI